MEMEIDRQSEASNTFKYCTPKLRILLNITHRSFKAGKMVFGTALNLTKIIFSYKIYIFLTAAASQPTVGISLKVELPCLWHVTEISVMCQPGAGFIKLYISVKPGPKLLWICSSESEAAEVMKCRITRHLHATVSVCKIHISCLSLQLALSIRWFHVLVSRGNT